ncbi:MAG TPA: transcriptional repressor [Verrucomicrobiae bacterium]|nr:transcriptional repressor [Verrucomicrobiae bacterium]
MTKLEFLNVVEKRNHITEHLSTRGFRLTPQRQRVYDVLVQKRDHPTADEVFVRAKKQMPEISHATVYNCLDALVKCGLVRQVQLDRGATRFCPNMHEHCHFYCDECEGIFDVDLPADETFGVQLPKNFKPARFEIAVHGICGECAKRKSNSLNR